MVATAFFEAFFVAFLAAFFGAAFLAAFFLATAISSLKEKLASVGGGRKQIGPLVAHLTTVRLTRRNGA